MGRRFRGVLLAILVGVVVIRLIVGPIKPQDVVACDFVNQPGPSTAFNKDVIGAVNVEGSIRATTVAGMWDYDGLAKWKMDGSEVQGAVSGVLWQTANGIVEGLFLTISSSSLSQKLTIATLNRNGMLDTDRSSAFLFTNRDDKFTHPVNFVCQTDRNYRNIYQKLFSYSSLVDVGLALIILAAIFLAGRKADSMDFDQR